MGICQATRPSDYHPHDESHHHLVTQDPTPVVWADGCVLFTMPHHGVISPTCYRVGGRPGRRGEGGGGFTLFPLLTRNIARVKRYALITARAWFLAHFQSSSPLARSGFDAGHAAGLQAAQTPREQAGWSYGQPFGGPPPLVLPLLGGGDAPTVQGRSQLRKRDFESELLERLLSHGNRGGLSFIPPHQTSSMVFKHRKQVFSWQRR